MSDKPTCAVRGAIRPGAMCSRILVGGELCGFAGECVHQIPAMAEADGAPPKLAGEPGCRLCDGCGWVGTWSPCICSIPVRANAALTQPEGGA